MVNGATTSDRELLLRYAQGGCAVSFAQLVRRHVGWVHGASLRQVSGDAHLAEDVTQAVFILLARRAATLPEGTVLTGWLFNTVRYAAAEARRKAARRRKHEARAAIPAETISPGSEDETWRCLAPLLDETLALLRECDRQAVLLRYYENKSFEEIATSLGINEAAARKRVSRAVHKLREVFVNRGVLAPAVAILMLLLTRAAGAATVPENLVGTVTKLATAAGRAAPLTPLSLTLVRRTTVRLLRARQRLAAAILACGGVAILGLWALLIASMLGPDAEDLPEFLRTLATHPPESTLVGQDPLTPTPAPDSILPNPRRAIPKEPTRRPTPAGPALDPFWHVRDDLDPSGGPRQPVASRAKSNRHPDPDYDEDYNSDTYARSYHAMGGGGGGIPSRDDARRPGQRIDNPIDRRVANAADPRSNPAPRPSTPSPVVTASAQSASDDPSPAVDLEHLTRAILNPPPPRGGETFPGYAPPGSPGPIWTLPSTRGARGSDYVHILFDPNPAHLGNTLLEGATSRPRGAVFDTSTGTGRGPTAFPVYVQDGGDVSAAGGPYALGPVTAGAGRTHLSLPTITPPTLGPAVPEPNTALLALIASAVLSLRRARRPSRLRFRASPGEFR